MESIPVLEFDWAPLGSSRELLCSPLLGGSQIGIGARVTAPASSLTFDASGSLGLQQVLSAHTSQCGLCTRPGLS